MDVEQESGTMDVSATEQFETLNVSSPRNRDPLMLQSPPAYNPEAPEYTENEVVVEVVKNMKKNGKLPTPFALPPDRQTFLLPISTEADEVEYRQIAEIMSTNISVARGLIAAFDEAIKKIPGDAAYNETYAHACTRSTDVTMMIVGASVFLEFHLNLNNEKYNFVKVENLKRLAKTRPLIFAAIFSAASYNQKIFPRTQGAKKLGYLFSSSSLSWSGFVRLHTHLPRLRKLLQLTDKFRLAGMQEIRAVLKHPQDVTDFSPAPQVPDPKRIPAGYWDELMTAEPRGPRRDDRQRPRGSGDSFRGQYRGQGKRPFPGPGFNYGKRRYF